MWDCNFSIAFLYASTATTTWDLEKREPTWSFSLWFCWLSCTSGMHFLSNPELSCSHAVSLWSAPFPDVADWSFIVVCPWLCREILLCCRVTTSIFFQVRKENEEEEEERKNPRVDCIESQNQHHAVAEIPSSLWCLPPRLSVFAWSQWLLEPPSPTVRRAKSSPASTTTQSQALEGKAQARKATQTHWWKPVSATYAYRPPYLAGLMISVVDSLPVLQA